MAEVSSRSNPRIKLARSLRGTKGRRSSGLFLVEGLHHLAQLADSDFQVEYLLLAEESLHSSFGLDLVARFEKQGCSVLRTTPDILDSASTKSHSNGLLAVARQKTSTLADLPHGAADALHVALVRPQDPGNLGSILRTMGAVQAGGLILLDGGADPFPPAAVRASMGALFWHPLVQSRFEDFAAWSTSHELNILGTSAAGKLHYRELAGAAQPDVLLLGSEREGLRDDEARICSDLAHIPMRGRGSSLNLAVAAGIILYTLLDSTWRPATGSGVDLE